MRKYYAFSSKFHVDDIGSVLTGAGSTGHRQWGQRGQHCALVSVTASCTRGSCSTGTKFKTNQRFAVVQNFRTYFKLLANSSVWMKNFNVALQSSRKEQV